MNSAFLVFDFVGVNAGLELKCNARDCIHPELDDGKEAVRLVVREKGSRVPTDKASPKATVRIRVNLIPQIFARLSCERPKINAIAPTLLQTWFKSFDNS